MINSWAHLIDLNTEYTHLNLNQNLDYTKYFMYSMIANSTAIEGSTLTENEAQLLFDEGLAIGNKPIAYYDMNRDLLKAYQFTQIQAQKKVYFSSELLCKINGIIMKTTGSFHDNLGLTWDASKGEFRKCAVSSGIGGKTYLDYIKVPDAVKNFCSIINEIMLKQLSQKDIYTLSFNSHYNLVNIHPWVDGNGRTARLIMNYIQMLFNIPLTKVFAEDRAKYIEALQISTKNESSEVFIDFMKNQHIKTIQQEIREHIIAQKKNKGFSLIF